MKRSSSGLMVMLLCVGMLTVAVKIQPVKASGTVYILADGSIGPTDAPMRRDGDIYTLTGSIVDVTDGIVIYRSNVVLDGAGHMLQGTSGPYLSGIRWNGEGVLLQGVNNITIRNLEITLFIDGIFLEKTSGISIYGNNMTNNMRDIRLYKCPKENHVFRNRLTNDLSLFNLSLSADGIYLEESSDSWIFENNIVECTISLSGNSVGNRIYGNNITKNGGIGLSSGSNSNSISDNRLTNAGIGVYSSNSNSIYRNYVTHDNAVFFIGFGDGSSYNSILENNVAAGVSHTGISFDGGSSYNRIIGNNVTNSGPGIMLNDYSSNNTISGNNITNNGAGISLLHDSVNNIIYNNNFINNTNQIGNYGYPQIWDDSYPCGGNYWSNYNGTDFNSGSYQNETGSDGIGDMPHIIDEINADNYPLMGMFNSYNVTYYTPPLVPHVCNVTVISNSTISDFAAPIWIEHPENIFLIFTVTGKQGSTGFCRVSFPATMMNGTCHVSVNGTEIPYTLLPCSDTDYSYLYFNYTHSTQEVIIIPEFLSSMILPLFMLFMMLAVVFMQRKTPRKHKNSG